ncbi:MAG: hypothetical protein IPG58_19315 [Acidobacteria bacterium]|nr:hypothetical protein [Acidobacteriota bacterium]
MKKAIGSIVKITRKNILLLGLIIGIAAFGAIALLHRPEQGKQSPHPHR